MYYPDLSPYMYLYRKKIEGVFNVGWLGELATYTQGRVPNAVTEKLVDLLENKQDVNKMRGTHACSVCGNDWIYLQTSNVRRLLGMSEIWIPDKAGIFYAAPSLVVHYITEHQYQPPQVYMDAVLQFELKPQWSAEQEFDRIIEHALKVS